MFTLTSFTSCSSAMRSSTGETAWHGPHHSAQKSTITLPSAFRTSVSNVSVVAVVDIRSCRIRLTESATRGWEPLFPARYDRTHVHAPTGQTGSPCSGAGDPGRLGAGADVRAAARTEPRRPEVVVHRRPCDGEQVARGPYRVGADAQGRLPALQGPPRLRPAVPERLRLPGAVDRGRRRARARAELEARDRGVRAGGLRAALPRGRRPLVRGADRRLEAARPMDGLGQRLLHLQRHEHRVHLEVPQARERARLALRRPPLDRVVPSLRDVALAARAVAVGGLPGEVGPVALRPLPAARPP